MLAPKINVNSCKGCGLCVVFCPQKALSLSEKINLRGVHFVVSRDPEACTGCGICYSMCPDAAIEVVETPGRKRCA